MSRSEYKPRVNLEQIKDRWYDTYNRYTRLVKKNGGYTGICPLHSEKTPSLSVYSNGAFKCFGCGASGGSIIDFIMEKERLDFKEAMDFIIKSNNITPSIAKTIINRPKIEKEETLIEFNPCKFQRKHKDYWNKYLLPEDYLKSQNVFAVKALAYNKAVQDIKDEAVFAYWAEDIKKPKILRIGRNVTKKTKWRTTIPNEYLWAFPKQKVNRLFIAKSYKDRLVLNYHFGLDCTAVQNEDAIFLLQNNYEKIENAADEKVVVYGSDFQGWHQSMLLTEYTGWRYLNTPCNLEKIGVVDPSDMIDEIGLEPLKLLLKKKNFI